MDDKRKAIMQELQKGEINQNAIAIRFAVSKQYVSQVKKQMEEQQMGGRGGGSGRGGGMGGGAAEKPKPKYEPHTEKWREYNSKLLEGVIKSTNAEYLETGVLIAYSKASAIEAQKALIKAGKKNGGVFDDTTVKYSRYNKGWEIIFD